MSKHQNHLNIQAAATFAYLQQIQLFYKQNPNLFVHGNMATPPYDKLQIIMNEIRVLDQQKTDTKKLYRQFHEALEKVAIHELQAHKKNEAEAHAMDKLFIQAYENENEINALIYDKVIESVHNKDELTKNIKKNTTHPNKNVHFSHPDNMANAFFTSMLGIGYHPLKRNNVPYVAFRSTQQNGRRCIRIGAQTQKSGLVNPSFKRYLLANARRAPNPKQENQDNLPRNYDYVYINLLKRSARSQTDIEKLEAKQSFFTRNIAKLSDKFVRYSEGKRGKALELLNFNKELNTAVITLPADNLFLLGKVKMREGGALGHHEATSFEDIFESLKYSITYNKNDFYFSNDVRTRLFGNQVDNGQLEILFNQAVKKVIGNPLESGKYAPFTPEQRNAILFQFIKFDLSHHILDTLAPRAYNFSCKDGIDRGAIHTLWYHVNEGYQLGKPMTEAEFMKHLESPALTVKYRGLNHNRNLIWNALNHRMMADIEFAKSHPWAADWLKNNLPPVQKNENTQTTLLPSLTHHKKHNKHLPTPPQLPKHTVSHTPLKK